MSRRTRVRARYVTPQGHMFSSAENHKSNRLLTETFHSPLGVKVPRKLKKQLKKNRMSFVMAMMNFAQDLMEK